MARTIVLLNKRKEQITNSSPGDANHGAELNPLFPQEGAMPESLTWSDRNFSFMDQPTHETDEPGAELYRYIEQ
jgi:hypothetical protein